MGLIRNGAAIRTYSIHASRLVFPPLTTRRMLPEPLCRCVKHSQNLPFDFQELGIARFRHGLIYPGEYECRHHCRLHRDNNESPGVTGGDSRFELRPRISRASPTASLWLTIPSPSRSYLRRQLRSPPQIKGSVSGELHTRRAIGVGWGQIVGVLAWCPVQLVVSLIILAHLRNAASRAPISSDTPSDAGS